MGLGRLEIGLFVGKESNPDPDGGALLDGDKARFPLVDLGDEKLRLSHC